MLNAFLYTGAVIGACSISSKHWPGIAVRLGIVHPSLTLWKISRQYQVTPRILFSNPLMIGPHFQKVLNTIRSMYLFSGQWQPSKMKVIIPQTSCCCCCWSALSRSLSFSLSLTHTHPPRHTRPQPHPHTDTPTGTPGAPGEPVHPHLSTPPQRANTQRRAKNIKRAPGGPMLSTHGPCAPGGLLPHFAQSKG